MEYQNNREDSHQSDEKEPSENKPDLTPPSHSREAVQCRFSGTHSSQQSGSNTPNKTGLPDHLKSGIEALSGYSMDSVRVHYHSNKPAQLQAHAYAQGTDIHLGPGQEKHLPHEAWHVVQQASGRVAPTRQMAGTSVNDDHGLEAEADNMGARAAAMGATAQSAAAGGSPATAPGAVLAGTSSVAQREPRTVHVRGVTHLVKLQDGSIYAREGMGTTVRTGDEIEIDDTDFIWSRRGRNVNKAHDRHGKHQYEWFRVLKLNGEPVGDDMYLRDETFGEVVDNTGDDIDLDAKIVNDGKEDLVEKAHGSGTAKEVTESQEEYQGWLQGFMSMGTIMDQHRSVGFEYEFASYSNDSGESPGLDAHIELGKSELVSPLFPGIGSFVLETDSGDEIEAVTPPLLLKDEGNALNKDAVSRIYELYRQSLVTLRNENKTKSLRRRKLTYLTGKLEAAGLGGGWNMEGEGNNLYLNTVRKKHEGDEGQIYSQMNISLTPEEIASFTDYDLTRKGNALAMHGDREYASSTIGVAYLTVKVNNLFRDAVTDAVDEYCNVHGIPDIDDATKLGLLSARINISKGLASLVAIPSILASNKGVDDKKNSSINSNVKEVFGIWLKDSIPNIADGSLKNEASRTIMRTVLEAVKTPVKALLLAAVDKELEKIKDGLKDWYSWPFKKGSRADTKLAKYKETFKGEYKATMKAVERRLYRSEPKRKDLGRAPEYGKESFGRSGKGVRQDTFVNIASGNNKQMHLAEIRNDTAIKKLLE